MHASSRVVGLLRAAAVISVAVLRGAGAAGYYLTHEGCEHELVQEGSGPSRGDGVGYYVNEHAAAGRWVGGGAAALGLTGNLGRREGPVLEQLLAGSHAGERLVPPVWRRDETGARADVRRAGFDVTLSAPKSVSTLMALAPAKVAAQIVAAHETAAAEALGLLERLAARAARGHQGDGQRAPRIATSGLVAAAFTHTTSRALDPQLHTHVVIANLAQAVDGRWSALDSRTLHREATTASYLYQHRLRAELTARLGLSWTEVAKGVAEVAGVPTGVRLEFSTRRRQIETALTQHPAAPEAVSRGVRRRARHLAARAACLATRPAKQHRPEKELRQSWAGRAVAAGFGPDDAANLLLQTRAAPAVDLPAAARAVLQADGVTREQSTFGQGAVLRELIARLPGGAQVSTDELLATAAELVTDDEVIPVLTEDGHSYTTRQLLVTEAETLTLATRTGELAALDRRQFTAALVRETALRPEQQRVAYALLTSGRPVEVIAGPAGSGKTAGLRAAAAQWQKAGVVVAGTAIAALTAQGLEHATGSPAVSLARLLSAPDRHLPAGGALLVDEAGMVGTRQLHQLLTLAAQRQCKVVLVGDPEQLPELEAGGMFARLTREPTALHLDGHHRQTQAWEQAALQALRDGDLDTALAAHRLHDRLHTGQDRDTVHADAATAYLQARAGQPDPWHVVLLASSRDEVRDLNQQVRQRLLADGNLGSQALNAETEDGMISYRTGDQVLVTRNDHRRGLLNGTTATITHVDKHRLTLTTSSGRIVDVDRTWLEEGRLDHGYAMTVHKAQGRTVHTALLVGDGSLSSQAGYVGLSRGTHANHLYLTEADAAEAIRDCGGRPRYLRAASTPGPRPLVRDTRQRLALQHERPRRSQQQRARREGRGS
ncbi:MAG: hypothetical protein QOJ48_1449 [Frankiales bacterium]|nr:hypothetical protein [Frankiales bacterium]